MIDVKTILSGCAHLPTEFNTWYKGTRLIGALDDLTRAYGSQASTRTEMSLRPRIVIKGVFGYNLEASDSAQNDFACTASKI